MTSESGSDLACLDEEIEVERTLEDTVSFIMYVSCYFTSSVCTGVYVVQHSPPLYLL